MARKLGRGRPYDKDLFKNIDKQPRQYKHDAGMGSRQKDHTRLGAWDNQIETTHQVQTRKYEIAKEDDLSFLYENRPMRRKPLEEKPKDTEVKGTHFAAESTNDMPPQTWGLDREEPGADDGIQGYRRSEQENSAPELDYSMANGRQPRHTENVASPVRREAFHLNEEMPKERSARRVLPRAEAYDDDGLDTLHRRPVGNNARRNVREPIQRTRNDVPWSSAGERTSAPVKRQQAQPRLNRQGPSPRAGTSKATVPQGHTVRPVGSVAAVKKKGAPRLTFRHELKYYINYRDYYTLRACLKGLLKSDIHGNEEGTYHIRSLYFDDRNESALSEKLQGVNFRKKYRIRIYNLSDRKISFEKKIKKGQFISKQSFPLTREEYDRIVAGDYDFLLERKEPLAQEVYTEMRVKGLKPKVIVDYIREAYVYPIGNVRITFDKDLCGGVITEGNMFGDHVPMMPMLDTGLMVLEIKFNHLLPDFIRGVLNTLNSPTRSAISKYVICRKYD